ncbi:MULTISPECIES: glycosyltransferase [Acidobacterium]|uniref:Glycosyl transferase, group 1 family n=1 Tax=Acidobacterium capsulatum (strain ATCC 51196 / DSM 11244 / BCRC 80197 / JCM 7670 / NBRC 15755 / NCIMB 13165 / 161) TaxID=240015 RepID=C1F9L8_ACIC5|nr:MULTISPECIES: glycosyltransferase [Acidobacterium]ACO32990.1 glycosyl transferase, group 1 family [Acidobacterium capsulatum ATCC 51196]HCT62225.1 transferase [Acidobacterium sp.]
MKILHAIQSLSPADGGPPQAVRNLMRAYASLGVEGEVFCLDTPGTEFLNEVAAPVHALGPRRGGFGYSSTIPHWLNAHLPAYDALVLHGIWNYTNVAARRTMLKLKRPYAVFPHGALDPWFNRQYPLKKLKKQIFWPWQYPVLRDAKAVLFTSTTERDLAATSFQPSRWNALPVPYGAMEPEDNPAAQTAAWFQHAPSLVVDGRPRRYLLFLARIHEKKGCDLLLQAFAHIAASAPDLHLVIAGPDQVGLQAKLQQQAAQAGIADRVHWPGMLRGDVKWGALRHCEAFVLPSHQENFGIAVAEALACGKPVLISDQVNIWPDIEADESGLVEKDTLEGTCKLLERWLALNPSQREAMVSRALPCFRKRYSMQETARAIRDLFSTP